MNDKLKILNTSWEEKAERAKKLHPLKGFATLPKMVGITAKTARFLKAKGLFYLILHDKNKIFFRFFFKKPFRYTLALLRSYAKKKSFHREKDFFFYGLTGEKEFLEKVQDENTQVIVGFSYCHKPMECPSGRFSDQCKNDPNSLVCNQCFIGKCSFLLQGRKNVQILYIPTIHYIGEKIFEAALQDSKRPVLFFITACELSLTMFGDWGNMISAKGIGVRLDGRICNTMRAFALSEEGIKPGLTTILDETKERMLDILSYLL
jgi:hypothetical protein